MSTVEAPPTPEAASAEPTSSSREQKSVLPFARRAASDPVRANSSGRVVSVDLLRGLVLVVMLLTPPIRVGETYPHLAHAAWAGLTLSDLVLPLLLVTSGASLRFLLRDGWSAEVARRLVRRVVALVVLGLLYNAIAQGLDLGGLRVTGVLQMIGIAGALAALLVAPWIGRNQSWRAQAIGVGASFGTGLLAWSVVMVRHDVWRTTPGVGPFNHLDESWLGVTHLYRGGEGLAYDPEGVASMLAASLLVLAGYLVAHLLFGRGRDPMALAGVALGGAVLVAVALALGDTLPVVKRVTSPTFMMATAGIGAMLLAAASAAFDREWRHAWVGVAAGVVAWPFVTVGWNALVVYVGEQVLLTAARLSPSGDTSLAVTWLDEAVAIHGDRGALVPGLRLLMILLGVAVGMRALRWRVTL